MWITSAAVSFYFSLIQVEYIQASRAHNFSSLGKLATCIFSLSLSLPPSIYLSLFRFRSRQLVRRDRTRSKGVTPLLSHFRRTRAHLRANYSVITSAGVRNVGAYTWRAHLHRGHTRTERARKQEAPQPLLYTVLDFASRASAHGYLSKYAHCRRIFGYKRATALTSFS